LQLAAAVVQRLIARIREHRSASPGQARFAERLLETVYQIERDFRGQERERLLALVTETFDRYVEIGRNAARAREALRRLRDDQARLLQLVEFVAAETRPRVLH
jgi:hypothetical protein